MKTLLSRIYPILTQSSLMNPRPIIVSSWLCIALTATAQPASAPATTIPNDSVVQLNAFTVKSDLDRGYMASQSISGSRFVTELKEFPFSLQVLSSALLQDIGAQSLPDALAYATGVVAAQSNQASEISVVQRGFVTTLQLRDGTRKPGGFDAVGAERIEVINGPSSVLFGITNPGGTINFLSKKPVHKPLAEFSQTLGSWGTSRTTLDLGGPLGNSGVLAFRMPSSYTSSDGYYVNSSSRKAYTSPVISWQVTPATKIEVGIELQKSDYIPVTSLLAVLDQSRLAFFLPREFNGNTPRMYMDLKTTLPTFSLLHNFGPNWQLRSNSSFYSNSHETFYAARGAVRASLNFAYPRQASFNRVSNDDFQHNTDVVGNFAVLNGSLTAIMGVEYRDSFNRSNLRSSNAPGGVAPPSWLMLSPSTWNYDEDSSSGIVQLANTTTDFQSTAFSLLAQYKSRNNRFTAAGGVRRDTTTSLFRNYLTGGAGQTFDANKVTMQIGGLYWLKPDALSVYANYSTSFLPLTSPLIDINFRPFNPVPVTGKGFETGIRQTLAQGRFAHSLGVYRIEQENLPSVLLRTSTATTVSFYDTQGGVHRSEGVEYNFNGLLTDNLAFFGGYTYIDAEVASDDNPVAASNTRGQRLAQAYRQKGNLYAKYTFDSGPLKNTYFGAGYVYVGNAPQQVGSLNSVLTNPSYGVVNLMGGYSWKIREQNWNLQVNLKNVLSRDFVYMRSITRSEPIHGEATLRIKF